MSKELSLLKDIKDKIHTIRDKQVMLDSNLAKLYGVKVKRLNEQVKRNIDRFPKDFMFQLSEIEKQELVAKCDYLYNLKFSYNLPYVFTEQGVSMLSSVLKSKKAVEVNIKIMRAFVSMRQFLHNNAGIFQRIENIELKQLNTDKDINKLFEIIDNKQITPKQRIFYNGQIFDAHKFVCDLIKQTKKEIILIDNYIDESVLILFTKIDRNIKIRIYTENITKQLKLDVNKFNKQYNKIELIKFKQSHDRFLIIDNKEVYHFGASLKDLGKKWFAFSKINKKNTNIIKKINNN